MATKESQISAYISNETRSMVDEYVETHGVKKGFLIESAILHHLKALRELPADLIIPPRIVVTQSCLEEVSDLFEKPLPPTKAMIDLFETE